MSSSSSFEDFLALLGTMFCLGGAFIFGGLFGWALFDALKIVLRRN